jgi:kinesin family protein 11
MVRSQYVLKCCVYVDRTGTEANQLLRSKLSSAVSSTLEDIDVANEALLSSIDSKTAL